MSFVNECVQDSLPIWEECLNTPFLRALAEGTLEEDCLKGYIVEDSLYLREYAKVFAWGILHATTMQEIRTYHSLLSYVNESEDATRLMYLKRWGITDEQVQKLPLRPENQAYIDTMLEAARSGSGAAECMMACLPCMLSYTWIFERLLKEHHEVLNTLCGPLVRDYAAPEYALICSEWANFTDEACKNLSDEQKARCKAIFRACSEHELNFWRMSAAPREDI